MTKITVKDKVTALGLMGLIGGYLGLFVGVSFTTIVEFAEYFIDLGRSKFIENKTIKISQIGNSQK